MANLYEVGIQDLFENAGTSWDLAGLSNNAGHVAMILYSDASGPTFLATHATVAAIEAAANTEVVAGSGASQVVGYARTDVPDTKSVELTSNVVRLEGDEVDFTALGDVTPGDGNDTITAAVIYHEGGGADSGLIPLAFYDLADFTTNGGNVAIQFEGTATNGAAITIVNAL